jgi:hypothetical protein
VNGIINANPGTHPMSVSNSSVVATATALQGVTEAANVDIAPNYLSPVGTARNGYQYYNTNLDVGVGGADIGSQGPWTVPSLRANQWFLYR